MLNLLAGRQQQNKSKATGHVLVNGVKRDFKYFRLMCAYVQQYDCFFSNLTVLETITLAALLRLPNNLKKEEKLSRAQSIIKDFGLNECINTKVGKISGGERKRLNIASELISDPLLMFLDEPTTGLDSFNAQNTMSVIRKLAFDGRTVLTTIHQVFCIMYVLCYMHICYKICIMYVLCYMHICYKI